MSKITISYRRDDSMDITGRIFDRLTSRYGRETVFRDIDNIPPGLDFREHIRASIDDSDVLMVVVGPRWMGGDRHGQARIQSETDYVRVEVEAALHRHIPVIPLLVGGADMPEPGELPDSLRDFAYRNAVPIDSGRDFDHHMNGLIRATDKILQGPSPANVSTSENEQPPTRHVEKPTPATAPTQGLLLPLIGGVMTVIGLMETAWFIANLLSAMAASTVQQMFEGVWSFADLAFGVGGLVAGIGVIRGTHWGRLAGIIVCLLITFSNLLWFIAYFGQTLPPFILVGTGFATLLAAVGAYLLLFRWPQTP